MDKVFVYLLDGSDHICYWSGYAKDFTDPNPKNKWLQMKRERAVNKVDKDYECGMIQLKMAINDQTKLGAVNYKQFDAWNKPPPRRLKSQMIRCFIF